MARPEQQLQAAVGELQRASERETQFVSEVTRLGSESTFATKQSSCLVFGSGNENAWLAGRTQWLGGQESRPERRRASLVLGCPPAYG